MLTCPCGKEIYQDEEYGIMTYKHKDTDNYCGILNSYGKDIYDDYIGKQIAKALVAKDIEKFDIYNHKQFMRSRMRMYILLSESNVNKLTEYLNFIFKGNVKQVLTKSIIDEMVMIFGFGIVRHNLTSIGIILPNLRRSNTKENILKMKRIPTSSPQIPQDDNRASDILNEMSASLSTAMAVSHLSRTSNTMKSINKTIKNINGY